MSHSAEFSTLSEATIYGVNTLMFNPQSLNADVRKNIYANCVCTQMTLDSPTGPVTIDIRVGSFIYFKLWTIERGDYNLAMVCKQVDLEDLPRMLGQFSLSESAISEVVETAKKLTIQAERYVIGDANEHADKWLNSN